LDTNGSESIAKAVEYPDLYREIAESLEHGRMWSQALTYYQALLIAGFADVETNLHMARCNLEIGQDTAAEDHLLKAIQLDDANIEARVELAKMYERLNEPEQAFIYVNEIMTVRRHQISITTPQQQQGGTNGVANDSSMMPPAITRRPSSKPKRIADPVERQKQEHLRSEKLQADYDTVRKYQLSMRTGQETWVNMWLEAASDLIDDFRSFKTFYPWDKYVRFLGYTESHSVDALTDTTPLDVDLAAMADRISHSQSLRFSLNFCY
jgi:general transcription factor 3C polypeptide 3 (transcription factor C subunit 4)